MSKFYRRVASVRYSQGALCMPVSASRLLYKVLSGRETAADMVHAAEAQVLLTISSTRLQATLAGTLPSNVTVQLTPLDNPLSAELFLSKWQPQVGIIMGSPFIPNLVLSAQQRGVRLALLSASLSPSSMARWGAHAPSRHFLEDVLRCFDLIIPTSEADVRSFSVMGALGTQIPGWSKDLQEAATLGGGMWQLQRPAAAAVAQLRAALQDRCSWIAAGTLQGEEVLIAEVHRTAAACLQGQQLLTILSPADSSRCSEVEASLQGAGLTVMLWSSSLSRATPMHTIDVLLLDLASDLPLMYSVAEVAFTGGSLVPGRSGSSLSQAAVAGCALLLGPDADPATTSSAHRLNRAALSACRGGEAATSGCRGIDAMCSPDAGKLQGRVSTAQGAPSHVPQQGWASGNARREGHQR
ncbi:MAG: hypothetical protein WDW36_003899 [Sanguina aurantia]